mgnify:CR=1 FL=1
MNNQTQALYLVSSSPTQNNASIIEETDDDVTFATILQVGDILNRNNKIYPTSEIENATINDPRICDMIRRRCWFGESNHPQDKDLSRQMRVERKNVSHSIIGMTKHNNTFKGTILTTRSEDGKHLKGCVDQGSVVAFSMRGLHRLEKTHDGHFKVSQLKVLTYDWVDYPGFAQAQMVPANESVMFVTKEAAKEVMKSEDLATESADILAAYEDVLNDDIGAITRSESGLVFHAKNSGDIINLTASRALTKSILNSIF